MHSMANVSDTLLPAQARERFISESLSGKWLPSTWDTPRALPKKPATTHPAKTVLQLSDRLESSLTVRTRGTSSEMAKAAEQEQEPTRSTPRRLRGRGESSLLITCSPSRHGYPKWDPSTFRMNLCPPSPEPRNLAFSTPKKRRAEPPLSSPERNGSYSHRLQKLMRRRSRVHSCRMLDFSQTEPRFTPESVRLFD